MTYKKLVSYIKEQIDKGFDTNTIKYNLLKHGYTPEQVNEAFNEVYKPTEVKHIIHLSPTTMITLVSIFLGLVVISSIFFFLLKEKPTAQLLDIELEGVVTSAQPSGEISFITELSSFGTKKRYDVYLKHEIIDQKTYKTLTMEEETKAIETSTSFQTEIWIPKDALPGDYILRTIATYNGQRATATLPIKIEESGIIEEIPEEEIPEEPEIIPEEEIPEEIEEEEQIPEPSGTLDIDELTSFEALEKVRERAKQDPLDAASYCPKFEFQTSRDLCYQYIGEDSGNKRFCEKIQDERTKDNCYANVAKKVFNPDLCKEIKKVDRRDSCYMSFVVGDKNDFSVCDKVINEYLKQSCNSLKQLSDINATKLAFYNELIKQKKINLSLG